jgi:hypothetical protein
MALPPIATELDAANAALSLIGVAGLSSFDEARTAARVVKRHFGTVRDALLKKTSWNFASAQATLSLAGVPADQPFGFRYLLPEDCLVVRSVPGLEADEWAVTAAGSADGPLVRYLDTAVEAPVLLFTRRVVDPIRWSPDFTVIFVQQLAEVCAPQCTRSGTAANRAHQVAAELLPEAKRADARERAPSQISRTTSWISARRGR